MNKLSCYYQHVHIPFGLRCAPGLFEDMIVRVLTELSGVTAYLDGCMLRAAIVMYSCFEELSRSLDSL